MTGPDSWTATGPRARPDPNPAAPETRIPHRTTEPPTEARFPTNGPSPASRGLGRSSNRVGTTRRGSEAIHATSRARWPLAISGPRANPPSLPGTGVEPAHPFGHMALNHARLPIPPPGRYRGHRESYCDGHLAGALRKSRNLFCRSIHLHIKATFALCQPADRRPL